MDDPTAESVLGIRPTERVGDDSTLGQFWRWRPPDHEPCPSEAYLWSGGSTHTARVFSMLLLPFTLINVAYWARPPRRRGVVNWVADGSVGIICRLIGLTLTVTLILAVAGSAMDLLAWQCLGSPRCSGDWPQPFSLLGEVPLTAGQRLAVGASVPLLVLLGLWYHSLRTWRRHEHRVAIPHRTDELTGARFWRGRDWVDRLRASHVLVGMAVVDGLLVFPMVGMDTRNHWPLAAVGYALLVLVVGAVGMAVLGAVAPLPAAGQSVKYPLAEAVPPAEPRWYDAASATYHRAVDRAEDLVEVLRARAHSAASPVTATVRRAAAAALALTVAALGYAAWPRPAPGPAVGSVPGYAGLVVLLSALQVALLLALGTAMLPLCRAGRRSGSRMALFGFVAPVVASTAVMLAAAEAAGTLYFTSLSIGQLRPSATGRAWEPAPPYPYEWSGLIFALSMLCAAVAALLLLRLWRRLVRSGARFTDRRNPRLRVVDPFAAERVDRAHARGRILDHLPGLVLVILVPAATVSVVGVVYSALGRGPAVVVASPALANLGAWSIGLAAAVFVYAVARSGAMTPVRRTVSTIWSLATFWPRAAHPFAAPAHGPRAVADLVSRTEELTADGTAVLVAGHSHGALLGIVAMTYLPPHVAANVALLTSASTGPRLIEPFFGAFLNRAVWEEVAGALTDDAGTRWRNLYRLTDPLGGAIFDSPAHQPAGDDPRNVDRLAPDPPVATSRLGGNSTVRGHDNYLHDAVFVEEHARLIALLARRPAVTGPPAAPTVLDVEHPEPSGGGPGDG